MTSRNYFSQFDIALFAAFFLLLSIGTLAIYSSTYNNFFAAGVFYKHLLFVVLSFLIIMFVYFLHPLTLKQLSIPLYVISILGLILVIFFGKIVYGQKSWLQIGAFGFQPSELSKAGLIFLLAKLFSEKKIDINSVQGLFIVALVCVLPLALILLEPDVGTSLIVIFMIATMLFWHGLSLFGAFLLTSPIICAFASFFGVYAIVISLILVIVGIIYFKKDVFISSSIFALNLGAIFLPDFFLRFLKPHQQKRILTFLNPEIDPLGSGYNAIQAKTAVGSGGLFGKGFLQGSQTQLKFVPEQWTDFIFCVIAEEFGFVGSFIVIVLFLILLNRILKIAIMIKDKDSFSSFIAIGTFSIIFAHFFINIGMSIGLLPIIGIPLTFVSYGGTSLLINVFLLASVLNIYKNRKYYS